MRQPSIITENSVISKLDSGFFSCCTTKLCDITDYIDRYKKLPKLVDSSNQFSLYKRGRSYQDVTYDYFEHYENIDLDFKYFEPFNVNHRIQYKNYQSINYELLSPIVKKYFTPSIQVKEELSILKKDIDFQKTCVLFYRGNDKALEVELCKYEDFLFYANKVLDKDSDVQFFLQSDETEFFDFFTSHFPNNSFYFKDKIRHMPKQFSCTERKLSKRDNYLYSKYYLAITYFMSQCKYVVCQNGNTSLWVALYRGNSDGVFEFHSKRVRGIERSSEFKNKWVIPNDFK